MLGLVVDPTWDESEVRYQDWECSEGWHSQTSWLAMPATRDSGTTLQSRVSGQGTMDRVQLFVEGCRWEFFADPRERGCDRPGPTPDLLHP